MPPRRTPSARATASISHPAVGEQADLLTSSTAGAEGIEYAAGAAVRVHDVVARFTIFGTPGNLGANPANALALPGAVTRKL